MRRTHLLSGSRQITLLEIFVGGNVYQKKVNNSPSNDPWIHALFQSYSQKYKRSRRHMSRMSPGMKGLKPYAHTCLSLKINIYVMTLTLPMLRLISSKAQRDKDIWKPSKPCHFGIHWIALIEHSQMSTHVPGFQSYFRLFASFLNGQISHQLHSIHIGMTVFP